MNEISAVHREKLMSDLRTVIADAEEVLLHQARIRLGELQDTAVARAKAAGHAADDYVHENPWRAIGVAAGIGVIIGLLIGRR